MITNGFFYLAFLVLFSGLVILFEKKAKGNFFKYVPAIVVIYFAVMLLATFHVWEKTDSVNAVYSGVKNNLLYAMIFLMLLRADLRQIVKLGPKMLIGFFSASITIGIGFIVMYLLFKGSFGAESWKAFAALAGSWMGGTGNMVAIQGALNIADSDMGYTLLIDSIDYSIWVMMLLALVPYEKVFSKFTKADSSALEEVTRKLQEEQLSSNSHVDFPGLMLLLGASLAVSAVSQYIAGVLPTTNFLTGTTWTVIIATVAGIGLAMTKFGKTPGSTHLSSMMLYTIVALIASRANFAELTQAPLYILAGFVILFVHAGLMVVLARIFKLDLFTCGVASLANIGGVASAPILAASYGEVLIPVGVLMAMMGYIIGTGGGLIVGNIMSML
ncbi:MAG: DUF819 domain-containing protein [Clostridia bacterium]|nr:DUF819 domain-containing protein [Clostridia bacterium]